jgi:hypothetical protein
VIDLTDVNLIFSLNHCPVVLMFLWNYIDLENLLKKKISKIKIKVRSKFIIKRMIKRIVNKNNNVNTNKKKTKIEIKLKSNFTKLITLNYIIEEYGVVFSR